LHTGNSPQILKDWSETGTESSKGLDAGKNTHPYMSYMCLIVFLIWGFPEEKLRKELTTGGG